MRRESISNGMQRDIGIGMAIKSAIMRNLHSAEDEFSALDEPMHIITNSTCESYDQSSKIDHAIGRDDAVFIFHVGARTHVDRAARGFDENPAGRYIPQD